MLSSRCKFLWQCRPVLLCLLSLQWEGRNCQQQTEILPGFKIEAPAKVTVQRGLCVLIPCKFMVGPDFTITRDAIGIWYKGYIRYKEYKSVPVAASTNASQFPDTTNGRFIFTGKVSAGDCSFSISDAQPGDATHYLFRLEDKYSLKFSYMGVQPTISVSDCPEVSPNFRWEGRVNKQKTQMHTLQHQYGKVSYWSTITFTPSPRHHHTSLTCTVTFKEESTKTSITLNVEYLNKPDIFPKKKLIAGEQVTLTCSTFGNCMETSPTITWDGHINIIKVGNYQLLQPRDNITYLSHITFTPLQTDHNTLLTCSVTCKGISTNHGIILDVEYLNKPDIFPKKKLIAGKQVTLTCRTFGNCMETSSTITWDGNINTTKARNNYFLPSSNNITYLSHITFTPSQTDHNTLLTCTVTCYSGM
ncbi:hypothetical protein XELAEV_18036311mg [Xenopus laevis]|uniref:Ig-like domain-containing protein n=1 Tax=Xenopus laevis TaxID=8355 RepID=A0A974CHD9_XENLA|nr:hypothetical protein XELAEV_18036311mg [Xenopus laevis]